MIGILGIPKGIRIMSITLADLTPAVVTLDGELTAPAFLTETRWNGWECPYFKVSDVRGMRDVFDAYGATILPDSGTAYSWDAETDLPSFVDTFEDEAETYEQVSRMTIDGEEFVTIGWGSWVWSEHDEDDAAPSR